MSINEMSTHIMNRTEEINETTMSSDISFLPSGFRPVVKAISNLSKTKRNWKPKVVSEDQDYLFMLEDALRIKVPKEHWAAFLEEMGGKVSGLKALDINEDIPEIDITPFMVEIITDESRVLLRECRLAVRRLVKGRRLAFEALSGNVHAWVKEFGRKQSLEENKIALRRRMFEDDLKKLFSELKEAYEDDIGGLQMLLEALKEGQPLSGFEVFENYSYLFGEIVHSNINGVDLIFEAVMDCDLRPSVCIKTKSSELLSEVRNRAPVIFTNEGFRSRSGLFKPQFLSEFRELVDQLSEGEELIEDSEEELTENE